MAVIEPIEYIIANFFRSLRKNMDCHVGGQKKTLERDVGVNRG